MHNVSSLSSGCVGYRFYCCWFLALFFFFFFFSSSINILTDLRNLPTLFQFKSQLKTFLFHAGFPADLVLLTIDYVSELVCLFVIKCGEMYVEGRIGETDEWTVGERGRREVGRGRLRGGERD